MDAMRTFAIDPGTEKSAWVLWEYPSNKLVYKGIYANEDLLNLVRNPHEYAIDDLCIEMIASYGMPVGREIFETCLFIGRLVEAWYRSAPAEKAHLIYRREIKLHFCQSPRAKDANIRQALIDLFGDPGTKKAPGVLYGIKADEWSALAIAVYFQDRRNSMGGQ